MNDNKSADINNKLIDTLRTHNHNLISANAQLLALIANMDDQLSESNRYAEYLEKLLIEMGWTPGKEHQC